MINLAIIESPQDQRNTVPARREDNRLRLEDRAAHDWYRFVLSFPAHLVRTYIERFQLSPHHTVLDPFCGTGTTLVECKKLGIRSHGIEPNPMAAFASRAKVDWEVDPEALAAHATHIAQRVSEKFASQGIEDEGGLPLFQPHQRLPAQLKTIPPDQLKLLLTGSISPIPLHKTLLLLETLGKGSVPSMDNFLGNDSALFSN